MNRLHLLTTVAASLLLAAGTAAAQGLQDQKAPGRAPAAQQNAPAEKFAPPMHAGRRHTPETTGQGMSQDEKGTSHEDKGITREEKGISHDEKGGRTEMRHRDKATTSGQGTSERSEQRGEEKRGMTPHERRGNMSRDESKSDRNGATTGQGAAAGAAKLTTEQRSKITTIIKRKKVEPAHLNISVHVGARVPASVHFYPLPAEVVTVYPEWRGYDYILVGDQILVIDPDSHAIVAILEA